MKHKLITLALITPALAFAQEAASPAADSIGIATSFVVSIAAQYPKVATVLMVIGLLRAVFKPIVSAVDAYVKSTESTEDDAAVLKVESSKWWKVLTWVLDFGASIKVGPQVNK